MNYRLHAHQIGRTPAEPLPVSRALIAAFWTVVAMMVIWTLPFFLDQERQVAPETQQAYILFFTAVAFLTAAPALAIRSHLRTQELRRHALLDPLTRLPGELLFRQDLTKMIERSRRRNTLVSVIVVDLGGLTAIRHRLGSRAHDQLLVDAGRRLRRAVRPKDVVARTGEAEFSILLAPTRRSEYAAWTAERAVEEIDAPFSVRDEEILLAPRAGVGLSFALDSTPDRLIRTAGHAVQRARLVGRSRYAVLYVDMVGEGT